VTIAAILSTLLTLVYTFLTGIRIFFSRKKIHDLEQDVCDPPLAMSLPLLALAAVALVLGIFPKPFLMMLDSVIGTF
jgi:NADH:ubiquinone oxidoreductase subunit 5 (subunit L)/multisubunit Na+/H+ antiporter MnhA subunit